MGVLRKILILPTTPSLSNKNSFLQIVCTSFGVLIVFYFHIYMVCLNHSAWVFFGKFQFCLPPLLFHPRKKVFFKTVCAGFKVFQVVLLLSNSIYGLFERLYMGNIFLGQLPTYFECSCFLLHNLMDFFEKLCLLINSF